MQVTSQTDNQFEDACFLGCGFVQSEKSDRKFRGSYRPEHYADEYSVRGKVVVCLGVRWARQTGRARSSP